MIICSGKSWLKVAVWMLLSGGMAAQAQQPFVAKEQKRAEIPAFEETKPQPGEATCQVRLNVNDTLGPVSPYLFGTNATLYSGNLDKEPLLTDHLKKLKPGVIRFPGGLHSDEFFWNAGWDWNLLKPNGKPGGWYTGLPDDLPPALIKAGSVVSTDQLWFPGSGYWSFDVQGYYDLLQKTGAEGLITVNYGYARYGTGPHPVQTAAHLAAEWVRFDRGRTRYWEIGNENVASWSGSYEINTALNRDGQARILTPKLYGEHCRIFIDSMQKAAAETGTRIFIGVQNDKGVMEGVGNKADWYVDHTYYTNYRENADVPAILNSAGPETEKYASKTVSEASHWGVPVKPLAMTEWNIFAEGSKQAASFINGIHAVLVICEMARNGYGMANRWNIANGWSNGDDMGLFSGGDDPDGKSARWNPRAPYFYLYYLQRYLGNHLVNAVPVSGGSDVKVYASVFDDRYASLVIVNKGKKRELVSVDTQTFGVVKRFYVHSLEGGKDNPPFSLQVVVNGKGPVNTTIGGPADGLGQIKAWSLPEYSPVTIDSPGYSVQFVLLEKGTELLTGVEPASKEVRVFPNPARHLLSIDDVKAGSAADWLDGQGRVMGRSRLMGGKVAVPDRLQPGIYYLRWQSGAQAVTRKVIIQTY